MSTAQAVGAVTDLDSMSCGRAWSRKSIASRLADNSMPEPNSGCVLWLGQTKRSYGRVRLKGNHRTWTIGAHRAAWEVARGAVPSGLYVLHRCDTPPCINVDHLFLGTQAENMYDMASKGRSTARRRRG